MTKIMSLQKKERIIWISASIVILAIAILAVLSYQIRISILTQRVADLESSKTAWVQKETELTLEIADLKAQVNQNIGLIKSFPSNNQEIIDDLTKHSELIPYKGVLGGKMDFYNKENIFVISDKWVLAYFEDGHIGGNMLLGYSVENENIFWKVIDSYLFK
mgnify:CR=1 FL=1